MYVSNKCGVKSTDLFGEARGVFQGNSLSPTLFNIYINDLAVLLEQSGTPAGQTLNNKEVKFLLYADDLVLLRLDPMSLQPVTPKDGKFHNSCHPHDKDYSSTWTFWSSTVRTGP